MRLRVIAISILAAAAIAGTATFLSRTVQETSGPHSSSLVLSIVGYTNRAEGAKEAMLEVRNRGSQPVWLNSFFTVHYFDAMRSSEHHSLSNAATLPPGATQLFCFPAPPRDLQWRAEIGGVGQREITVKQALKKMSLFKDHPFVLHPHYSQTEWITP